MTGEVEVFGGGDDRGGLVVPTAVSGEIVDAELVEPGTVDLVLVGRRALAATPHNPDDWMDPETEEMLADGMAENTVLAMERALGAAIWYCSGRPGHRVVEHMPMTVATVCNWIKDHKRMTKANGDLAGRRGKPYSPKTVQLRVYLMATIWKLKGHPSPVGHPKVQKMLKSYAKWYSAQGFTADQAHAISYNDTVTLIRSAKGHQYGGQRNRAMWALQRDTGMRVSELLALDVEDVVWSVPEWAPPGYSGPMNATVRIRKSKTDQEGAGRPVGVEYVPYVTDEKTGEPKLDADKRPILHPEVDVDPAGLLWTWVQTLAGFGITSGALWPEVRGYRDHKDGTPTGRVLAGTRLAYEIYEMLLKRAAKKAGIHVDPVSGEKRRITSHMFRAGHITTSLDEGEPVEKVAMRTGHSPRGSIHDYYRNRRRFGSANTGAQTRRRRAVGQVQAPAPPGAIPP